MFCKIQLLVNVFKVGDREFSRREVFAAADLRGELEPVRRDITDGLVALAQSEAIGLDHGELQAAVNAYRREQGLITAEETEEFLGSYQVSLDDLCDCLGRQHWRHTLEDELDELRGVHEIADEATTAALWGEVVFSGALQGFAKNLAERIALGAHVGDRGGSTFKPEDHDAELERLGVVRDDILARFDRFGCGATWLDELIALELLYHREIEGLITPRRCEQALVAQRLSLTRVEVEIGYFDSLDAAREAFLCVTQDGDEFAEVLELAGAEGDQLVTFIDDLPDVVSQLLLSAMEGETLAPVAYEGSHLLCRLVRKVSPELEDPDVMARIQEAIVESQLGALVDEHVVWLLPGVER